jgi:hypothetical protein
VDLDEILYGADGFEYYLDYILFNPVVSSNPKWRTCKFLMWAQLLNLLMDLDEILYGSDSCEYYIDYILFNLEAFNDSKKAALSIS